MKYEAIHKQRVGRGTVDIKSNIKKWGRVVGNPCGFEIYQTLQALFLYRRHFYVLFTFVIFSGSNLSNWLNHKKSLTVYKIPSLRSYEEIKCLKGLKRKRRPRPLPKTNWFECNFIFCSGIYKSYKGPLVSQSPCS